MSGMDAIFGRHRLSRAAVAGLRTVIAEVLALPASQTHECSTLVEVKTGKQAGRILCPMRDMALPEMHREYMEDGVEYMFLHTHPNSAAFSPEDANGLLNGIGVRFAALALVASDGTLYLLSPDPDSTVARPETVDAIRATLDSALDTTEAKFHALVVEGVLDQDGAWREHSHEAWELAQRELGLRYDRVLAEAWPSQSHNSDCRQP